MSDEFVNSEGSRVSIRSQGPERAPFRRLEKVFDLAIMQRQKVAIFGLGSGGMQVSQTLAACGVGEFFLSDPGRFDLENVATTMIDKRDVGRAKVEVAAERIAAIGSAKVTAFCVGDSE